MQPSLSFCRVTENEPARFHQRFNCLRCCGRRSFEGYLEERYVEIVQQLVAGIREVDPKRLIFADGINIGQAPVMGIAELGLVQSTRGYLPKAISHYTATWGAER